MKNQTESEIKKSIAEGDGKKDNPEQSQRFVETAKDVECDESGEVFEKFIGKVVKNTKTITLR